MLPRHLPHVTAGQEADRSVVHLDVLGPLEIRTADTVQRPGAARQRRILTILAMSAAEGRTISSDELIEATYGADPPPRVRRSLSTELWRCRQLLGGDAILGEADGYHLDTTQVEVDVLRFIRELEQGRALVECGEFADAAELLSLALDRWRGAPLPDWRDHPDGLASVARLEELRIGGSEDLCEALAGTGRHAEAVATLQAITRAHAAREHAWALLIECYLALGDRRRARTALDSARRTLAEHGVDLGVELRAVRDLLRVASGPAQPASRAAAVADAPSLAGRREPLTALVQVLGGALRERQTAAVVVTGEAGIGKSALLEHAVAELAGGAGGEQPTVGTVNCDRRLTLPYGALTGLFSLLETRAGTPTDGLATLHAGGSDPDTLREVLVDLVEKTAQELGGLVLVVEDVHWATPELIDLLVSLLARRAAVPLAIVISHRHPHGASAVQDRGMAELRRRALLVVPLTGLDEEHTHALLGSDADLELVRAAHGLTGGNPLYLRHLTVGADGRLVRSATVREALDEHIDSLPADTLTVMELAATIGTRFDARALAGAGVRPPLDLDPAAIEHALRVAHEAGLVRVVGQDHELSFVHKLVRDRLYERTPARVRTTAHALIARALDRIRSTEEVPADLIAFHARRGWPVCPTAEVVAHAITAGEAAIAQLGFADAQRHFRSGLDVIAMDEEYADHEALARLLAASGQVTFALADTAGARTAYRALTDHGARLRCPATRVRGALGNVQTYANERVGEAALDTLHEALAELLDSPPPTSDDERDLVAEAISALHVYRPETARALRVRATERDPAGRATLLTTLWAQETVPQALSLAEELTADPDAEPLAVAVRRWASQVASGERALTDEPAGIWAMPGSEAARWDARIWQITVAMGAGRFSQALRLLDEAEHHVARAGSALQTAGRTSLLLGQRMWLAFMREDATELARLAELNRPSFSVRRPIMRTAGAIRQLALGAREDAYRYLDELHDEFIMGVVPARDLHASVVGFSNACLWLGHDRGVELSRKLLAGSEGEHVLFYLTQYWGSVNYNLGKLAAYALDLDEAEDRLRLGVEEHARVGARVLEMQARRIRAGVLHHRNHGRDRTEAQREIAKAVASAEQLGLTAVANREWPPARPADAWI